MFSMPDKSRMRCITELYHSLPDSMLRQMDVEKPGPMTIGEAISFIMDEPALSQNPLTVDPILMGIMNLVSEYLGTDDEANQLRMIHFAPMLSTLTRTAHVISPGTVKPMRRAGTDAHGRKYVAYEELPAIEFVYDDNVAHEHKTFKTYLDFAKYGVRPDGGRPLNKISICIAAKQYLNTVCEILGLGVMRMEREYNAMIREGLVEQSRATFNAIEARRARQMGVTMDQFNRELTKNATGPNTLFDPDGDVAEEDVLVAL